MMPRSTQTKTHSAPSPGECYLAHITDFFIFNFIFISILFSYCTFFLFIFRGIMGLYRGL
jgi:hypothetical protein